jgi:GNAT superfamily N-acetyltransferase
VEQAKSSAPKGVMMPRIQRLEDPTEEDRQAILAPLEATNQALGFVWHQQQLALVLQDDEARIIGGLLGELHWGWLHVSILAVTERLRGKGWGSRLLLEAERIAIEQGCHHAWLDTFSFQARPFYERLGYTVFGELPDYPVGHSRYFLSKALDL